MSDNAEGRTAPEPLNSVLRRNIETLQEQRREHERSAGLHDRLAQGVSRFAGSMGFVYAHVAILSLWIVNSVGLMPGVRAFDPGFTALAVAASTEAIFLSAFILIAQNRAAGLADRRSDLDLQISLLTEHEVTRALDLCTRLAVKLGIEADPKLRELTEVVAPERVLREIEHAEDEADRRKAR